jgi:hypothetical protein
MSASYSGEYPNLGTVTCLARLRLLSAHAEYWGGHPRLISIHISANRSLPSDSGMIRFSGWNDTGCGNLVIIDHWNGYRTDTHTKANLLVLGRWLCKANKLPSPAAQGIPLGTILIFASFMAALFSIHWNICLNYTYKWLISPAAIFSN